VLYKVTDYYAPASESGLLWNDPELGIDWPLGGDEAVINARDSGWPGIRSLKSPF
jgi:dTDP-4-dehydrorhamnose 3,5-epimerase